MLVTKALTEGRITGGVVKIAAQRFWNDPKGVGCDLFFYLLGNAGSLGVSGIKSLAYKGTNIVIPMGVGFITWLLVRGRRLVNGIGGLRIRG